MSKLEELRRLADALAEQWSQLDPVDEWRPDIEQAATALCAYADSLERAKKPYLHVYEYVTEFGLQRTFFPPSGMQCHEVPLYLHPPRSDPPKMGEFEIAAHYTRFFEANPLAESADWDLHFQDLRDKQWRGEE